MKTKNTNPWEQFHKYKENDRKNHQVRHPGGAFQHHCPSWWGQFICNDCKESSYCECYGSKINNN